jgi:uncharacterized protein
MDMTGEYRLTAPRAKVWDALNDPDILRQAIPGCEEVQKLSDTELAAKVVAKVGPVSARFAGKVTLSDLDPPNGYRISGEGSGGAAGFAKGGATVHLADDGAGTLLTYKVEAQVGGKLAQIGSRLIDATARKMAGDFFSRFAAVVDQPVPEAAPEAPPAAAPAATSAPSSAATSAPPAAPNPETAAAGAKPAAAMPAAQSAASSGAPRPRMSPILWVVLLAVVVAILLYFFAGRGG